ncbi:probable protein phosphatase 2C 75 [Rutidosis leptorrhynchoides]|uniref:probable protein phosphatase 2C 75 n=1 Tax=Rutidosis leptorrhynchoides TaxID=125765 RepID=UPI003A99A89A
MTRIHGSRRSLMPIDEHFDSQLKCRERRRRRIEMRRRLSSVSAVAGTDNLQSQKLNLAETDDENFNPPAIASLIKEKEIMTSPVYGSMSVVGRAREMEDEISVRLDLCRPEINGYEPVHYFGVFDGHGGHHVSALCKDNMHVILEEELMRVKSRTARDKEELWRSAISRSFERIDEMAMTLCECNGVEKYKVCKSHPQFSIVGSTAVIALLTPEYLIVANCGDSRAVLCRNGKAVPLSVDHKPDREDERARIEALGGRILFAGNGARVEGVLAMSRAIGDRLLKQVVTSEPEFMFIKREAGDMNLILASDGLWDVLSSELSCEVVHKCQEEDLKCNLRAARSATAVAAALLVRLAMGRRSSDNISVIVVDLRN